MASEIVILTLVLLGLLSVALNTLVGGGAGVILLPALILLFQFSAVEAVGTSFLGTSIGAAAATIAYTRQGRVDYKAGLVLGATTLPGVVIGSFLTGYIEPTIFNVILGGVVMGLASLMYRSPKVTRSTVKTGGWTRNFVDAFHQKFNYRLNMRFGLSSTFLTGFFAGAFGAGGGLILTPTMLLTGFPVSMALGTVRLVAVLVVIGGTATRLSLGHVNVEFGLWLSVGSVIGGFLGARLARIPKADTLRKIIATIILILGLSLVVETQL